MLHMDEKTLVAGLRRGENRALKMLIEKYSDYVYSLAVQILKNHGLAEEATNDVFLRVYQKINLFDGQSRFSTWLYSLTYRYCLNYRSQHQYPEQVSLDNDTEADWITGPAPETEEDTRQILWRYIDALKMEEGLVLTLFYLQQFQIGEIAVLLEIPENTVKTHLHRGRINLKKNLEKHYSIEELV